MRRIVLQFVLFYAVAAAFLAREAERYPAEGLDRGFVYWLAGNTQRAPEPAPLLLVELNDSTLSQVDLPLSALDYSLFFQAAIQGDPAVIGVLPVLELEKGAGASDRYGRILHDLILRSPKVILGAKLGHREDPDLIPPAERVTILPNVEGDKSSIPEYEIVAEQPDESIALSAKTGFVNLRGRDPVVQSAPLLFRYRGQVVPGFALQTAMLWHKVTPEDVRVIVGSHIALGDRARIPIDRSGRMLVDFATPISRFGYDDMILAVAQKDLEQAPLHSVEGMAGKVVLLARTDRLARVLEFPRHQEAGVGELIAIAVATIQQERYLVRAPRSVDISIVIGAGIIGFFFLWWSPTRVWLSAFIVLLVYLLVAMSVFASWRIWLPFVLPTGLMLAVVAYGLFSPRQLSREPSPPKPHTAGNAPTG